MWKDLARPFLRPLPQWAAVGVASPQQLVTAVMRWEEGSADVTCDHTVASLNPLVIASSVDAGERPQVEYRDAAAGRLLGVLRLVRMGSSDVDGSAVILYQVASGKHYCLSWPRRPWNAWLQNRQMLRNQASNHLNTAPHAVQQLMIAYLCPRPVVLVSVQAPRHRNIFPMDLIGPLDRSGLFSLALRTTNVSVPIMREVRQVALSNVPAAMKEVVYKLSEHHRRPLVDGDPLPFALRPSQELGIPAVSDALRVQELTIVHSQEIGLHTLFLGRVISDERAADGAQLSHTAGFHQAYRQRHGAPLPEA
jgi:flavin reductase (DIM6/NTAB) family NADH-FMN oxidoreductase RutF